MKKIISCLGAGGILVIIFGTIYATVQQAQRADANWPQIQMAEDAAAQLDQGQTPASLTTAKVNMSTGLAPFIVIYDKSGRPLNSSGYLNGQLPSVPIGVLHAANGQDYHAVTWQPQADVRIAAVTVAAHNYYVLSGRSLKEVEKNENKTFSLTFLGGVASMVVLVGMFVLRDLAPKK